MHIIVRNTARRHAQKKWEARDDTCQWSFLSRKVKIALIDDEVVAMGGRRPTPMRRRPSFMYGD